MFLLILLLDAFSVSFYIITFKKQPKERIGMSNKKTLISGRYINQYSKRIEWKSFCMQFLIWGVIVILAKIFSFTFQSIFQSPMMILGNYLFRGITNPNIQLVLVLVIIPLFFDIFQV